MFERKITRQLEKWKSTNGKAPLVIKGLRQVGKTSIVKDFAAKNYENAFILDFRKQPSLASIFKGDFDIDSISLSVSSLGNSNKIVKDSKMVPYKTVLVFDELQDCPEARSSLKYFKEDGRFDVICTGSLLGIDGYRIGKNTSRGIGVGSEEQIEMFPMDFEEFLWAIGVEKSVIEAMKKCVDKRKKIPSFIHERMLETIKKYVCVGGMPEVVAEFITNNDMSSVRKMQLKLLNNYKSDFGTHLNDENELVTNDSEKTKILDIFNSIPKQLARENKKFKYSDARSGAKARSHESAIAWLKGYGLIDVCHNITAIEEPFSFFEVSDQFKIYVSDMGLLCAMLDSDISLNILSDNLGIGKGMIYENLVAEAFHKNSKPLYYFSKTSGLEIDFISNVFSRPCLVEVKAKDGNAKSSKIILGDSKYKVNSLLKLTSQNISDNGNVVTMPYYLSFYVLS